MTLQTVVVYSIDNQKIQSYWFVTNNHKVDSCTNYLILSIYLYITVSFRLMLSLWIKFVEQSRNKVGIWEN